jgi:hypothetical protein
VLTPAVGSDFAKILSKLPPEERERCTALKPARKANAKAAASRSRR